MNLYSTELKLPQLSCRYCGWNMYTAKGYFKILGIWSIDTKEQELWNMNALVHVHAFALRKYVVHMNMNSHEMVLEEVSKFNPPCACVGCKSRIPS